MIPFIIAGAVGFGIAKLLEKDTKKYAEGGDVLPKYRVLFVDENGRELDEYFATLTQAKVRFNQYKKDKIETNIEKLIKEKDGDVNYESTEYSYTPDEDEEYADGGKVSAKLKKLKSEMKQIWEEIGEQYSDKKEMLMSAGYDGSEANDLKHEEWKYLGNDVQIKLINDYFAYYEKLAVYVQGVGSIYNGTSMQSAVNKANSYLKNNPKAEIVISDEKYGDTYDLDGYKIDEEYAVGGVAKKRRRSASAQYGRSNTAVDKTRVAKPVGYRFTNAKASELRKDPYAKPTEAQLKKYLGKGIYKENRKRHSDKDRNAKL